VIDGIELKVRFAIDDQVLSELHARAFGTSNSGTQPWARRLERHSLTWIGAFDGDTLIGFVHACWDGGSHAFVLDTIVDTNHRRQGVGRALVRAVADQAAAAGCEWLHVDYEPQLEAFYLQACGFERTSAGLVHFSAGCGSGERL
jgi:ribosomal protein S18 acetylase RimI-like enzyme